MNKNALYLAVFAVLCVLSGVIVGASITKDHKWADTHRRPDFKRKADGLMGYESRGLKDRKGATPVEMLSTKLGLNTEQKEKITKIFEDARQDIEKAGKDIRESIKNVKEKTDRQIMDVLDATQKEKFQQLQEDIKRKIEARKARMQGGRQEQRLPSPPPQE
jgi:hypothetical protein